METAVESVRLAVRLGGDHFEAHFELARLEERIGRLAEAEPARNSARPAIPAALTINRRVSLAGKTPAPELEKRRQHVGIALNLRRCLGWATHGSRPPVDSEIREWRAH